MGTPLLRSTCGFSARYLRSGGGSLNGSGVGDGSSASAWRSPGSTTRVCEPSPSPVRPASRTSSTVALATTSRASRKQPGVPVYPAHSARAPALPPQPPTPSAPPPTQAVGLVLAV